VKRRFSEQARKASVKILLQTGAGIPTLYWLKRLYLWIKKAIEISMNLYARN
jgi:hypothetical protein